MPRLATPLNLRRAEHGEGPLWDADRERIVWVDISGQRIFECDPAGEQTRELDVGSDVGFVALRRGGGFVAGLRDGFAVLDAAGNVERFHEVDIDPSIRFNDGAATPAGTVLAGTMHDDAEPDAGTLWSFDGRDVRPVLDGLTISNGLAWADDGRTVYFVDSGWGAIDAFDYEPDPDRLSNRRTIFQVPDHVGVPDGLTIDAEGCLWLALYHGAQVLRVSPDGHVLDRVVVAAPNVTSMAFAGPDLDRLVITTSTLGMEPDRFDEWPRAGALFHVDPGVRGVLEHRFVA